MFRKLALALAGAAVFATAAVAHAQPAPDYVKAAAASDKFEITEAELAQTRSHDPHVLRFARMMVRDHTKSTNMIKAAVRAATGHNPPPPMLTPDQAHMVGALRGLHGRAFDRAYVDQQVQGHEMALQIHQSYAQNGEQPDLRRTAGMIVPVVQQHLAMARDMQSHMR